MDTGSDQPEPAATNNGSTVNPLAVIALIVGLLGLTLGLVALRVALAATRHRPS